MNKSLYKFGIFFLGLIAACNLLQAILQLILGNQLFTQSSFIAWFIARHIVWLAGAVILFKYYRYRNYRAAFYTGVIATAANLVYAAVYFAMLLSWAKNSYYMPLLLLSLIISIIYALTLIFSATGKRVWLRASGIYMLTIGLAAIVVVAWSLRSRDVQLNKSLEKAAYWVSFAGSLVPVFFIMHLLSEVKLLNEETIEGSVKTPLEDKLQVARILALITILVLGTWITGDGISSRYWDTMNFENTKKLARIFEARMYVNNQGDTLRYRLLKPLDYDPQKHYPLVVSLPYGGQPGTDTIRQIEGAVAAEVLTTDSNRRKYPAFIFIPNCPPGSGWGGVPNYPSVDTLVYKAITALDTAFSIDAKRRYVSGISRGGAGAWHFICMRPDLFAAAIPVSGVEEPQFASQIVDVDVWAFHGAKDNNAPVVGSRGMIAAMRKAGQTPKYTEYPDKGHNIWWDASHTPGLWDWLFAQRKD
jgi:hypothetical protein